MPIMHSRDALTGPVEEQEQRADHGQDVVCVGAVVFRVLLAVRDLLGGGQHPGHRQAIVGACMTGAMVQAG